jgi:hypothetical protein
MDRAAPPTDRSAYGWLPGPPWLLQDDGRSSCGPVHCPLWPAPLPPLVGGLGEASAVGVSPTQIAPAASSVAAVLRVRSMIVPTSVIDAVIAAHPPRGEGMVAALVAGP